jgi:hypothetical protein
MGVCSLRGDVFLEHKASLTILNTVVYKGLVVVSYAARDKEGALYIKNVAIVCILLG